MDTAQRMILCVTSAAMLTTGEVLLEEGWQSCAVSLAAWGTFAFGILAAAKAE